MTIKDLSCSSRTITDCYKDWEGPSTLDLTANPQPKLSRKGIKWYKRDKMLECNAKA